MTLHQTVGGIWGSSDLEIAEIVCSDNMLDSRVARPQKEHVSPLLPLDIPSGLIESHEEVGVARGAVAKAEAFSQKSIFPDAFSRF